MGNRSSDQRTSVGMLFWSTHHGFQRSLAYASVPITSHSHQFRDMRVSDLRMASGEWNWEMIKIVLCEIDHDELRRYPIHALNGIDKLIWNYNSNGVFFCSLRILFGLE